MRSTAVTVALILSAVGAEGLGLLEARAQVVPAVLQRVAGTWDWVGARDACRANPHTISVDIEGRTMSLRYPRPEKSFDGTTFTEARYEMLGWSDNTIRAVMVEPAETRTTSSGQRVVWELVLSGRDRYRWHRTDWPAQNFTREVKRCRE